MKYLCAVQVEVSAWVDPSEPMSAAEKSRAYINEHRLFVVQPAAGALQPGESAEVSARIVTVFNCQQIQPGFSTWQVCAR